MNDLRDDPNAHAPDKRDPTWFAASDTATVRVVAARDLRTVPMPDLRTPDAEARDLRTAGDKLAELTRQVGALQETVQLHDATLLAIARRFDELAARPLAMAEDAWGVG